MNSACPAVGGGASPSETAIGAFVANQTSQSITEVTEELLQFTPSQAMAQLDQFATVASGCPEFTIEIPTSAGNDQVQIGLTQEAFSGVGDQDADVGVTADVTTKEGGVLVYADIVAVRHGGTVILVVDAALQLNTDQTDSIVKEAYNQVAARW
jgi:hypothetical protein